MVADAALAPLSRGSARLVRRFTVRERTPGFWVGLWALAVAAEFGALAPVMFGGEPVDLIDVVFRLVGGSFAVCGLIAWHRRPDNRSGLLMTATGFAFFVSPLVSQLDAPVAKTVGLWLPDLWIVFFVPLLLTYLTGGRLRGGIDRILVGAILVELLVLAPLYLMFTEHEGNILLVLHHAGLSAIADTAQRADFLAVCLVAATVVAVRWRTASPPGRRAMLPSAAGAACLLLLGALLVVDLVAGQRSEVLLWVSICSLIAVPIAFLGGLLRSRLARGGLTELFRELPTMRPAELQDALAKVLGDPDLRIAYPRRDGSFADDDGLPVALPAPGGARSVAVVRRAGAQVAALVYDRSLDDDPELVEAVGAAATIALENRQLHAEAQARLEELRTSRGRIIAAADAERRRIERNLHDGAQQGLVTLALQLSLIQRRIREDPADAEQLATSASDELARSLADLRELARGIHPAALDQGLDIALEGLVTRSAVPVTVTVAPGPVLPEPVAFAAYFIISETLTNVAKYARATSAVVRLTRSDGFAVVEITDDGIGGADPGKGTGLRGLADRVESLGGRFTVSDATGGGTVVRADLPLPPAEAAGPV
jgi:signal transduction histidine kinase